MTREEFLAKYGERRVTFTRYYKFTFTFQDDDLTVHVGGASDDIYRLKVSLTPVRVAGIDANILAFEDGTDNMYWGV